MEHYLVNKFNRGEVDVRSLARDDFEKILNSAALMENFVPMRLGPMQFRPGMGYIGTCAGACYLAEFVASLDDDDKYLLEFYDGFVRVWNQDSLITRTSVTSTITNGAFTSNITGWTTPSQVGDQSATWLTGGYMSLAGNGSVPASAHQTLTGATDTGSEHAMRVVVLEAPVTVCIGTSGAKSFDIFKGTLDPGTHSLVFTPSSDITITFECATKYRALIDSVSFEAAGTFTLPCAITADYLSSLRYRQSADVMFCAWGNGAQFKIERRGTKSWSIADYRANDGPFKSINTSAMTLAPGALSGNTTLTASSAFFTTDHVGCLFRVTASSQQATASVTAEDSGTAGVRVVGVGNNRDYKIDIDFTTGSGVGTVTLQRSVDNTSWADMVTYTSDTSLTLNDGYDNAVFWYRLWVKTGDFTSGTIDLSIFTASSGIDDGICRITSYTSSTSVNVQVLREFLSTDATRDWYEGEWSAVSGYPTSVALYEGRLSWAGRTRVWLSVSDAYYSFDREIEGDSASISRTVGYGPVENITWLAESTRLLMGLATDVIAVRTNSFGEVLTQSNANLKSGSTQGAAETDACRVDDVVLYAHRNGTRLMALDYRIDKDINGASDKTMLSQDICSDGIRRIAVQQIPETRVYVVLDNGEARILTFEPLEDVLAWSRVTTDGDIEDVVVLPGSDEDRVYFVVNRDGGRFIEKLAKYSEAEAGDVEKTLDSFVVVTGDGTSVLGGLAHMNGKSVRVRSRSGDNGNYIVDSGSATTSSETTAGESVVVGLPYTAKYQSNKISGYVSGSVISTLKRVVSSSLLMSSYRDRSVTIGYDATTGQGPMPLVENGTTFTTGEVVSDYDEIPFEFDGETATDPRVHIKATGACTILAMVLMIEVTDKSRKLDLNALA